MKSFMKHTMATVVGIFITMVLLTVICFVSLAGMLATEGMSSPIEKNSILRLSLNGQLSACSQNNPFASLMGDDNKPLSLAETLTALRKGAANDKIKGIYIEAGSLAASPATAQELRQALVEFKKSGKWIVAYGDDYDKMTYYLASVADSVLLNPQGTMNFNGLASQILFFKDLMDKVGVKMQIFKVGTYKSAVEPYIATERSPANREQVTSCLSSIWNNIIRDVAASRDMEFTALNALADSLTATEEASFCVKAGLVDALCYMDEVEKILREKCHLEDEDDELQFASVTDVAMSEVLDEKVDEQIAVYYACGDIVQSRPSGASGMSSAEMIVGEEVIKELKELREDDDVKAVVIRVNSPGGSAYASEQIWREVCLLKEKKPVVVSMGGMAASGGYYISCAADRIFAEPTTLTGSIGIFSMIPDVSELMTQKIGIKSDVVKTNALADFGVMGRPFNETESALLQKMVERGYDTFTRRVAEGRGLSQDSVKIIGEGRVWTGEQGLDIGLVDELGNLEAAVAYAAKKAELKDYRTVAYPEPANPFASFLNQTKSDYLETELQEILGENYQAYSLLRNIKDMDRLQARIPFYPNIH